MNNEEKDTDKLKATKEAVDFYRRHVNATFSVMPGIVVLVIILIAGGVILMTTSQIEAILGGVLLIGIGLVTAIYLPIYIKQEKKRLRSIEKELGDEISKEFVEEQDESNNQGD